MLRKEPALGLLGLGLKPTTSTLSYIPEGGEAAAFDVSVAGGGDQESGEKERVRNEGGEEFTSS